MNEYLAMACIFIGGYAIAILLHVRRRPPRMTSDEIEKAARCAADSSVQAFTRFYPLSPEPFDQRTFFERMELALARWTGNLAHELGRVESSIKDKIESEVKAMAKKLVEDINQKLDEVQAAVTQAVADEGAQVAAGIDVIIQQIKDGQPATEADLIAIRERVENFGGAIKTAVEGIFTPPSTEPPTEEQPPQP